MALPPFFAGVPGDALTASRASVATLAFLASNSSVNTLEILRRAAAKMLAKMLVGEHPQTRLSAARR